MTSHNAEYTRQVTLNKHTQHKNPWSLFQQRDDVQTTYRHINTKAKNRLNVSLIICFLTRTPRKTLQRYTKHTHTQSGRLTFQKTNYRPHTTLPSESLQSAQNPPHTFTRKPKSYTLTSHMDIRGTHNYTFTVDPHHPQHLMQKPTETHKTPAQHYHTLHNSLPPVPDNSSVKTHIHTEFT